MTFTPPVPTTTKTRPKFLMLCGVGVIVIAGLGILGGVSAPLAFVLNRHHPFSGMAGSTPEMARMMALQEKMMESPTGELLLVFGLASILVGAWALFGAAKLVSAKPIGSVSFRRSTLALAVVGAFSSVVAVWVQVRNFGVMDELATAMAPPGAPLPPGFEHTFQMIMHGSAIVGLVMAVGLGIAKLGFLVWAQHYVATPEVVEHLNRAPG